MWTYVTRALIILTQCFIMFTIKITVTYYCKHFCLSFPRPSPFPLSITYDNTRIIICHYTHNIIRSAHIAIRTLTAYLPGIFYILNRSQFSQCLHLYESHQTYSAVITQIRINNLSIYRTFMFLIMIDNHKSYPFFPL